MHQLRTVCQPLSDGALTEKTYIDQVWDAIYDPDKHVVVQTAPAVRVALGEDLGFDPGERVTGKMVSSTAAAWL